LYEGDEVSGAHADEGGGVGLSLRARENAGAPVVRWVRTTLPWVSMMETATVRLFERRGLDAAGDFFAMASRSMVVCFLPEVRSAVRMSALALGGQLSRWDPSRFSESPGSCQPCSGGL
jgi:hypothetical protein